MRARILMRTEFVHNWFCIGRTAYTWKDLSARHTPRQNLSLPGIPAGPLRELQLSAFPLSLQSRASTDIYFSFLSPVKNFEQSISPLQIPFPGHDEQSLPETVFLPSVKAMIPRTEKSINCTSFLRNTVLLI